MDTRLRSVPHKLHCSAQSFTLLWLTLHNHSHCSALHNCSHCSTATRDILPLLSFLETGSLQARLYRAKGAS